MENTARKILIKSPNWVGDVVLSIPAIKALRGLYPDSYIAVLIKQELVDLLADNPAINEVLPYKGEKGLKKLSMLFRLGRTISKKNFDTAILFPNSFGSALIAFLAGIPCRVGYGRDGRGLLLTNRVTCPERDCFVGTRNDKKTKVIARSVATWQSNLTHQAYLYLNIIKEFTKVENLQYLPIPEIYINETDREWAVNLVKEKIKKGKYLIGINPGARFGPAKRWLADRFVKLGDRLIQEYNASLILFGGSEEKGFVSGIAAGINAQQREVLNMAGSTSLGQLAALIERCNVFITNDTGPMHIAYSVGTPVVAIFGSTDPNRTGPLGDSHKIVKKDVPCSPCFKRVCPFDMECMNAIEVEDVIKAVESLLNRKEKWLGK